jgi:hypothetical protein
MTSYGTETGMIKSKLDMPFTVNHSCQTLERPESYVLEEDDGHSIHGTILTEL